jgi:hypothetical protein
MKHWIIVAIAAGALSACTNTAVNVGGKAKVLSSISQPNLETCPIIRGDYVAFKGSNFGMAADWVAGNNKVIFSDNVLAAETELTQAGDPATLLVKVPSAAISGPIVLEVGGVKSDPINVTIADVKTQRLTAQSAVGECVYPSK